VLNWFYVKYKCLYSDRILALSFKYSSTVKNQEYVTGLLFEFRCSLAPLCAMLPLTSCGAIPAEDYWSYVYLILEPHYVYLFCQGIYVNLSLCLNKHHVMKVY